MTPEEQRICLDAAPLFKPGDMPPVDGGYCAMSEWAEVQVKAGLKQKKCCWCCKFFFPQELSDDVVRTVGQTSRGLKVNIVSHVCKECAKKEI